MDKSKLLRQFFFIVASFPKTIWFNFRTFDFKTAIHLPVLVGYNVKVLETHKESITFKLKEGRKLSIFLVRFGFGGPRGIPSYGRSELCLEKGGHVEFQGSASFGRGSSLRVSGNLIVGNHLSTSKNSFISCSAKGSRFGDDVMFGWNVHVRDSDGHTVYKDGIPKLSKKPFDIGNHVWLCAEAHVLKGVVIADNSIVGYRSTVTKSFTEHGSLIGGSPARLLQTGVRWGKYNENDEMLIETNR